MLSDLHPRSEESANIYSDTEEQLLISLVSAATAKLNHSYVVGVGGPTGHYTQCTQRVLILTACSIHSLHATAHGCTPPREPEP